MRFKTFEEGRAWAHKLGTTLGMWVMENTLNELNPMGNDHDITFESDPENLRCLLTVTKETQKMVVSLKWHVTGTEDPLVESLVASKGAPIEAHVITGRKINHDIKGVEVNVEGAYGTYVNDEMVQSGLFEWADLPEDGGPELVRRVEEAMRAEGFL